MNAALEGVRVLDLSERLAGPFAATILADFGADVIKIPRVSAGKSETLTEPLLGQDNYYFSVNRNKKNMPLNLKAPEGKDIFLKLVEKSDVVIHNFRPGVAEKLGIDYNSLKEVNPRIIYCSITGFGTTGPYALRPAYDGIIQAISGAMSTTGEVGGRPLVSGIPIADFSAPLFAAHAVLAALYQARETGKGQKIEASLAASTINLLQIHAADYFTTGNIPGPAGSGEHLLKGVSLYGAFKTRDGYILLTAHRSFENFCKAVQRDDLLNDMRFNTMTGRRENQEEINKLASEIIETKKTEEWCEIFEKGDVPHAPINNIQDVFLNPHVKHMGVLVEEKKSGQTLKLIKSPIVMDGIKKEVKPAALPGESTDGILSTVLGYDEKQIAQLREKGVI